MNEFPFLTVEETIPADIGNRQSEIVNPATKTAGRRKPAIGNPHG